MSNEIPKDILWHEQLVTSAELEKLHKHKGATLWFTGLSASGKSTLANAVARKLHDIGVSAIVLDGDNVRHGLNKDLGFSPEDRVENIRRIGEVAKLFSSAAFINLAAFISPYHRDRQIARDLQPETFVEVYCSASLDVCEQRDPKGLYRKARAHIINNFTGIDAPYEVPQNAELYINTGALSIDESVLKVITYLKEKNFIA